jgi:hypothetical protein
VFKARKEKSFAPNPDEEIAATPNKSKNRVYIPHLEELLENSPNVIKKEDRRDDYKAL